MRHRYLRSSLVGVFLGFAISLLVINVSKTPIEDVLAIPPLILFFSLMLNLVRFTAQGFRLHLLLRKYSTIGIRYRDSFALRGASEFFALTTLPFLADEAARAWLLVERGERVGQAFWISFAEMLLDTWVGSIIAVAAAFNAMLANVYYLAVPVLLVSLIQLLATCIFVTLVKGGVWLGGVIGWVAERLPLPSEVRRSLKNGSEDMDRIVGSLVSTHRISAHTFLLLSTLVVMTAPAAILQLLDGCGFLSCLYAFHSGNALGVLPITVGGSGLTEAGVYLYLSKVSGIDSMVAVIQWRIASYYLSLIISGILLVTVALRRRAV
ncbi:MAG: hypothetical protein QXI97_00815 [Nitrososphaerota archaeon]